MHGEQAIATPRATERATFAKAFTTRRRALNDAKLADTRKGKHTARAATGPTRLSFDGEVPQDVAKTYLPVGASIWKNRKSGGWCARCPPRARISEPGEPDDAESLRRTLRRIWAQPLEIQGLGWDSCPFELASVDG